MSEYLTDEEKAERIKRWWAEHGTSILLGLVIGIAGLVAWNWWGGREDARAEQASELFQVAQVAVQVGSFERAESLLADLEQGARGTPYWALSAALRAELETRRALAGSSPLGGVNLADDDSALAPELTMVPMDGAVVDDDTALRAAIVAATGARDRLSERKNRELRDLLSVRLARLHVTAGDAAAARATLDEVGSDAFRGLILEIEGDLAMLEGDYRTARERFDAAIAAGVDHEAIRLKRDAASSS
ncbi:MAG: YfgM family protein [Thioalkalivibrionaceae bacterium]